MNATVYVVRDASGEYVEGVRDDAGDYRDDVSRRTPCSDRAREFASAEEARRYCDRATDRVLSREAE